MAFQTPFVSRVPALVATEATISAFTAFANSTTPFHSARVRTPLKPSGGLFTGGSSLFWKYVVLRQVPLTRTYAGPSPTASLRSFGLERSMGGRYRKRLLSIPAGWS